MKAESPPLLPLVRTRTQADILTTVLLNADQAWTMTDIAQRNQTSVPTVLREITRAEEAGVVRTYKVGNTRYAKADADGVLTEPLTELLLRSFGPRHLLAELLSDVPGIDAAYLFGSWAARYLGQRGRVPHDVDVLVIGSPDRDRLDDAVEEAERRLARPVQTTIRRRNWWDSGDDAFRRELRKRPIVDLAIHPQDERTAIT